jgi:hypothetical protein
VFNAWLFANPDPTIEQSASLILHLASPTALARFVQKFVIEDGKVFELRRKIRDALKTSINERLEWLFGIATKLAASGNLTVRLEMIAERADARLVAACNRQLDHGHSLDPVRKTSLISITFVIYWNGHLVATCCIGWIQNGILA